MTTEGEEINFFRVHLTSISNAGMDALVRSYQHSGRSSFTEHLVAVGVMDRALSRTLDAVRKGYAQVPLAPLLGSLALPPGVVTEAAPAEVAPAEAAPAEVAPAEVAVAEVAVAQAPVAEAPVAEVAPEPAAEVAPEPAAPPAVERMPFVLPRGPAAVRAKDGHASEDLLTSADVTEEPVVSPLAVTAEMPQTALALAESDPEPPTPTPAAPEWLQRALVLAARIAGLIALGVVLGLIMRRC